MSFINSVGIPARVYNLANTLEPFTCDGFVGERRHNKFMVWWQCNPILLCTAEDGWMISDAIQKDEVVKATPIEESLLYILWRYNNLTIQQAKVVLVARRLTGGECISC